MKLFNKNRFFILFLIFVLFFSLTYVSALENISDNSSSDDLNLNFNDKCINDFNSSKSLISSDYRYLDSDTVFDEDYEGDFLEPSDDFAKYSYDVAGDGSKGVTSKTGTVVVGSNLVKYYLNDSKLIFGLKDSNNHYLANKALKVYFSNKIYNRTTNSSGMSYLNINLQPGNYTFNVKFLGDSSYSSSNKTLKVTVSKMPTSITSDNLIKDYGGSERLIAILKDAHGNPLSNKNLTVNITGLSKIYTITTNASGTASLAINLIPQVTNATIRFSQNNYESSSKKIQITINTLSCNLTTGNVDKYYGESTAWIAQLLDMNGNPLSGKILNFQVCSGSYNRTTNSTGHASLDINFSPRNVTGTVSFTESGYCGSSKNVQILVKNTPSSISCSPLNSHVNESRELVAILKGLNNAPLSNKTIEFNISGTVYNRTTDSNGRASYSFPASPINKNITVSFKENNYANSTETVNVKISYWQSSITASGANAYYGTPIPLTANLKGENNQILTNKTVRIIYNNKNITRTTDNDGNIHYDFLENAGNYNVTFYFNENYNQNCSKTVNVLVNKMPTSIVANNLTYYVNESTSIQAVLKDINNNIIPNETLVFNVSGTVYSRTTNSNGIASLNIGSILGNYNVIISFNDQNYLSVNKNVTVTVNLFPSNLNANSMSAHYGENIVLTATLNGLNNDSLNNKNILFSYNNKSFNRTTNSNGQAFLDFNEKPGNYNVNLSFNNTEYQYASKSININVLPPIEPNVNVSSGFYNLSNLLVNVSSNLSNSTVFCSFDNGNSWCKGLDYLSFNLTEGNWSLISYYIYNGFNSSFANNSFLLDGNGPFVWASHGSAIYNDSFAVNLSSWDIVDDNPTIYYTLDGSEPNRNSNIYNGPIFVENNISHVGLRFCSYDCFNHRSNTVCVNYFFGELVANLNNGKYYYMVQDAIDDEDTFEGDVIEVSCDLYDDVIINKTVVLRSCDFKDILWESNSRSNIILQSVIGARIEGFVFVNINLMDKPTIVLDNSSCCTILNNIFFTNGFASIGDRLTSNDINSFHGFSFNNYIFYNSFYGSSSSSINLLNCENYSIFGNVFNDANESLLDEYDWGHENKNYFAIYASNSTNTLIKNNYFANGTYGINMICGDNINIINNTFYLNGIAISLNGNDNYIFYNNLSYGNYSILINGNNNQIISNIIRYNNYGIHSNYSYNLSINFNSFAVNSYFGVYIVDGLVNATNNWWGHNYLNISTSLGSDIYYCDNLSIVYEPYLILNCFVSNFILNKGNHTSYNNSSSFNSSMSFVSSVGDLTRNNFGVDISNLGYIHDDEVIFFKVIGNLHYYHVPLVSGKSVCNLPKDIYGDIGIIFDEEALTLNVNNVPEFTSVYFNSSAYLVGGNTSIREYNLCLSDNVTWFSYVWKYVGDFRTEVNMIFNGNVFDNFTLESSFYHENKNNYSANVWNAIELYNDFLFNQLSYARARVLVCISLDNNIENFSEVLELYYNSSWEFPPEVYSELTNNGSLFIPTLLNLIKNKYDLSNDEINFVSEHYDNVRDSIDVFINYFGYDFEKFEFTIDNSSNVFCIGGDLCYRNSEISCVNGAYAHLVGRNSTNFSDIWYNHHLSNGSVDWEYGYSYGYYADAWYDGLMTFTFACDKVSNDVLSYCLAEKNRTDVNGSLVYSNGPMKAAYGSFLEGLLVIYMDDLVADAAAERYNVSWTRISPMVMSVHDNIYETFMSGESDFHFGREAYGDVDGVKAFYFACSACFSPIEHFVGETLFPGTGDLGSVTTGLGYILNHNGTLEIVFEDDCVLIHEIGNYSNILIYDNSTGILHDAYYNLNGAFCYSNQQTEWAFTLGEELLLYFNSILSYLLGNMMDLSFLNSSTLKLVKSCYAFLSLGVVFTESVTAESLAGLTTVFEGLGIDSLSTIGGYVLLPLVLFLNIEPVGERDGAVDDYWKTLNQSQFTESTHMDEGIVQIKKKKDLTYESDYYKYNNIANELDFFSWGLAVPSGDDGGNNSSLKTFLILVAVPFIWSSYYIGSYILKGLTNERDIISIQLKFNPITNETEVLVKYK